MEPELQPIMEDLHTLIRSLTTLTEKLILIAVEVRKVIEGYPNDPNPAS